MPADYQNFLVASTQASAALIGLLFVSVSIGPERIFGEKAEAGRQAKALSAFIALANVFFVSFSGLVPKQPIGPVVVIVGSLSTLQTLSLLALVPRWRQERTLLRGLVLFAVSLVIYLDQIVVGRQLWANPSNTGALTGLFDLLLAGYGIGLTRAWELLGAGGRYALLGDLFELLRARLRRATAAADRGRPAARRPPG